MSRARYRQRRREGGGGGIGDGVGAILNPLSAAEYWHSGVFDEAPYQGLGWLKSNNFDDGAPGDTTTRETGDASISVLVVKGAAQELDSVENTVRYLGSLTHEAYGWNGTAWVAIAISVTWLANLVYTDRTATATSVDATTYTAFRFLFTESDDSSGGVSVSDLRVA